MEKCEKVRLSFEEGVVEIECVTYIGGNLYCLNTTPVLVDTDASFGDIIEAEEQENGILRFCRIAKRSSWRHWNWLLSKHILATEALARFKQTVEGHGGTCESVLGGLFLVHLPPDIPFDPDAVLEQMLAQQQQTGSGKGDS